MKRSVSRSSPGFTFIELLVVVTALVILSAVVYVNFIGGLEKARIARAISFEDSIVQSIPENLVAQWTFESNCTAASCPDDTTGFMVRDPNNLAQTVSTDCLFGTCARLKGGGQLSSVGLPTRKFGLKPSPDRMLMMAWIKINAKQTANNITFAGDHSYIDPSGGTENEKLWTFLSTTASVGGIGLKTALGDVIKWECYNAPTGCAPKISTNAWHHIVVSYIGDSANNKGWLRYFVDGQERYAVKTSYITFGDKYHEFEFGVTNANDDILMDNVRFYSTSPDIGAKCSDPVGCDYKDTASL